MSEDMYMYETANRRQWYARIYRQRLGGYTKCSRCVQWDRMAQSHPTYCTVPRCRCPSRRRHTWLGWCTWLPHLAACTPTPIQCQEWPEGQTNRQWEIDSWWRLKNSSKGKGCPETSKKRWSWPIVWVKLWPANTPPCDYRTIISCPNSHPFLSASFVIGKEKKMTTIVSFLLACAATISRIVSGRKCR